VNSSVVRAITLCSLMRVNRRFGETYRFLHDHEASQASKVDRTTQSYIPEDKTRHHRETLKSNTLFHFNLLCRISQLIISYLLYYDTGLFYFGATNPVFDFVVKVSILNYNERFSLVL
jgi:hypothetical protein